MKNILFFINSLGAGGAEKVLIDMVNALDCEKFKITVQTLLPNGVHEGELNSNIRKKSIIKTKNKRLQTLLAYMVQFILPPKLVYRMFVKENYDVEVAYLEGFPLKLLSASNSNAKKYTWVHIDLYTFDKNKKHFKSTEHNAECYRKFDKIFCVSENVKEMFIKKFGQFDNLYVQYNVLDEENIKRLSQEPCDIKSDGVTFVSVGRLSYQKGYDRLVKICARLRDDGLKFKVYIVGEGTERDKLESAIKDNNVGEYVKLVGFDKNPYKYINAADAFVVSSRAEGFSTVATEALLIGKPIVTTECSGMSELLGDSEYGLITKNDDEALYDGMKKMITDANLRKHYCDMTKIRAEKFTKSKRIEEIERMFAE